MNDHLIVDLNQSPPVIKCLRCGKTEPMLMPAPLRGMEKLMKRWQADHKKCTAPLIYG